MIQSLKLLGIAELIKMMYRQSIFIDPYKLAFDYIRTIKGKGENAS